ncbi:MAG TPA: xylulose kinase, partial [Anaerolineae bacterium]|nr:xylulose kinase [Anaerolineae bacterium]
MAAEKYILAIDLGTSGPKVALFSLQGEMIGSDFQENRVLLLPNGGAEQSPAEWWGAINTVIKRLLGKRLVPNEDIHAIAITGQWSGTVAVDRAGNALGNAVIWMDSRGEPYIKKIGEGLIKIADYGISKLFRWVNLTGGLPGSSGKDPIAHILYLKHVHPEIYNQTYKFLEPIDYIGLLLTGRFAASVNSIILHWVTDNRNILNIKYDEGLIRLSGID